MFFSTTELKAAQHLKAILLIKGKYRNSMKIANTWILLNVFWYTALYQCVMNLHYEKAWACLNWRITDKSCIKIYWDAVYAFLWNASNSHLQPSTLQTIESLRIRTPGIHCKQMAKKMSLKTVNPSIESEESDTFIDICTHLYRLYFCTFCVTCHSK